MRSTLQIRFIISVLLFFVLNTHLTIAAPTNTDNQDDSSIIQSQGSDGGSLASPVTVTSVTQQTTPEGIVTTTCQITLTPITVNGSNMVQEEKSCHDETSNGNSSPTDSSSQSTMSSDYTAISDSSYTTATSTSSESLSTDTSSDTSATQATADSNVASPSNVIVIGPSSTTNGSVAETTAASQPSSIGGSPAGVSVVGQSSIAASATGAVPSDNQATTAAATTSTNTGDTANPTGVSVVGQSSVPAAAVAAGPNSVTAASDQSGAATVAAAASASTDFTLPGKKLQVLPIGLGVFAGVSVIALVVVGWVTYERTKYRKRFRQQKLAEAGAPMGYGGMT